MNEKEGDSTLITFEVLYELLSKEKSRVELQKLEPYFFNQVLNYLKEKQKILESQEKKTGNVFTVAEVKKTKIQLTNIKKILKELYHKRENKIIKLAMLSSRAGSVENTTLLPEEKALFNSIKETLEKHKKDILQNLLNQKLPAIEIPKELKRKKEKNNKLKICFTKATSNFIDQELNNLGPFEEGETAEIPKEIAQLLIKNGQAKKI